MLIWPFNVTGRNGDNLIFFLVRISLNKSEFVIQILNSNMPRAQIRPHAAAIYKFVYYINLKLFVLLFVFMLGSIAFEIRMFNAIKNIHI